MKVVKILIICFIVCGVGIGGIFIGKAIATSGDSGTNAESVKIVEPSEVLVTNEIVEVCENETKNLVFYTNPAEANCKFMFKSSDEEIARVTEDGCVVGVSTGDVTIKIYYVNKNGEEVSNFVNLKVVEKELETEASGGNDVNEVILQDTNDDEKTEQHDEKVYEANSEEGSQSTQEIINPDSYDDIAEECEADNSTEECKEDDSTIEDDETDQLDKQNTSSEQNAENEQSSNNQQNATDEHNTEIIQTNENEEVSERDVCAQDEEESCSKEDEEESSEKIDSEQFDELNEKNEPTYEEGESSEDDNKSDEQGENKSSESVEKQDQKIDTEEQTKEEKTIFDLIIPAENNNIYSKTENGYRIEVSKNIDGYYSLSIKCTLNNWTYVFTDETISISQMNIETKFDQVNLLGYIDCSFKMSITSAENDVLVLDIVFKQ